VHADCPEQQLQIRDSDVLLDVLSRVNIDLDKISKIYPCWETTRKDSVLTISDYADALDVHRKNTNISTITGSSVGIVGSVLALVGAFAAIPTFGVSLPLTAVGTGLAVAGGVTGAGSTVTYHLLEKDTQKKVLTKLNADMEVTQKLGNEIKVLEEHIGLFNNWLNMTLRSDTVKGDLMCHVGSAAVAAGHAGVAAGQLALRNVSNMLGGSNYRICGS